LTRHELKEQLQHDSFTDTFSTVWTYASENRAQVTRYGIVAAIVLAIIGVALWYASYRRSVRENDLQAAYNILQAQVGAPNQFTKTFPTQQAKNEAASKALADVVRKDGGSREAYIAQYYLGTLKVQTGDNKGAEADLKAVANSGKEPAELAKIALAQLYSGENRVPEAQELLGSIVNKPTSLVSKAQAEIFLARLDSTVNPKRAKSILQSLQTPGQDPAVARAASELSAQLK
jgi:predicted negative regulator of RcsB-dependent stress response